MLFEIYLQFLHMTASQNYAALQDEAANLANTIENYQILQPRTRVFPVTSIDNDAVKLLPADISQSFVPIHATLNGKCF